MLLKSSDICLQKVASDVLNKNTLGIKKVWGQSEAACMQAYNSLLGRAWASPTLASRFVLSFMHKKLRQKSVNLHVLREFDGVDYSASLYGSCYRSCHGK